MAEQSQKQKTNNRNSVYNNFCYSYNFPIDYGRNRICNIK